MHRNAEIWEKRHERLVSVRASWNRHHMQARSTSEQWLKFLRSWEHIERRVWNALCVAKGWRKA